MYLVYWEPNTMLLVVKSLILAFFCGVHIDTTQKGRRWKCSPCVKELNFALPRPWGQGYEIQLGAEVGGEKRWEGVHKALSWKQRYKSVVSGRKQDAERGDVEVVYATKNKYDESLKGDANGFLLFGPRPLWKRIPVHHSDIKKLRTLVTTHCLKIMAFLASNKKRALMWNAFVAGISHFWMISIGCDILYGRLTHKSGWRFFDILNAEYCCDIFQHIRTALAFHAWRDVW